MHVHYNTLVGIGVVSYDQIHDYICNEKAKFLKKKNASNLSYISNNT